MNFRLASKNFKQNKKQLQRDGDGIGKLTNNHGNTFHCSIPPKFQDIELELKKWYQPKWKSPTEITLSQWDIQQNMYYGKWGKNIQETSEDSGKEYGKHCKIWTRDKNLGVGSISVDWLTSGDIIKNTTVGSTTLMTKKTSLKTWQTMMQIRHQENNLDIFEW